MKINFVLANSAESDEMPHYMGLNVRNLSPGFANIKGADQPAHPRSRIRAFIIRLMERMTSNLAKSKFSSFSLVCVAEQTGMNIALSETPKKGFVAPRPMYYRVATVREKVLENEKNSRSGKSQGIHFQSGKFRKMKKSHGKVRGFQNFPKRC